LHQKQEEHRWLNVSQERMNRMTSLNHSLHVAVPTAFDHAERLQKQGIKSVLVCGSTGEQHSLTLTEKNSFYMP